MNEVNYCSFEDHDLEICESEQTNSIGSKVRFESYKYKCKRCRYKDQEFSKGIAIDL